VTQHDISLREYFRILRRWKGIVVLVPLLFAVVSFAVVFLQAPKPLYRATAIVRIERATSTAGLLNELVTFSPIGSVETQAALIRGFPVLSRAAKKLGSIPAGTTLDQIRASQSHLRVIEGLQGQIGVKPVEGASLIEISAISSQPVDAARVVNTVAEAFQEDNFETRTQQVREAREFIERLLQDVGTKLEQSEQALRSFKESNRAYLVSEGSIATQLAALEGDGIGIGRAIDDTDAQLRLLQNGTPLERQIGLSDPGDPTLTKLYASLSDLKLERESLLLSLLPAHPRVKQLDGQIDATYQRLREALSGKLQMLRRRADDIRKSLANLKQEQTTIPKTSLDIARMERDVKISERLFSLLKERHQEALIREKEQVAEVSLVRPAILPTQPINPPQSLPKTGIGLLVGMVMGCVLAFVAEALDTSIGAIDEVESLIGVPALGVIPSIVASQEYSETEAGALLDPEREDEYRYLATLLMPKSRAAEAFRVLRTNLVFSLLERDCKTIMITSSTQLEGKTTVALNLAGALAQLGKRTLLIEADLRNPFVHRATGIAKEPGFSDVVAGTASIDDATRGFADFVLGKIGVQALVEYSGIENLFVMPSGHLPPNPVEFLSTSAVKNLLMQLRERYDYVILDSAPVLPVADSFVLGSRVDATLLVVRAGHVSRLVLRRVRSLLTAAKVGLVGTCLTHVRADLSREYEELGYYYYRYGAEAATAKAGLRAKRGRVTGWLKLAALIALLLALGLGFWAWQAGLFKLSRSSAVPIERLFSVNPPADPRTAESLESQSTLVVATNPGL
jgi:capsular exopolysaccharide synthesis family protein